jgi:hypothetical protein
VVAHRKARHDRPGERAALAALAAAYHGADRPAEAAATAAHRADLATEADADAEWVDAMWQFTRATRVAGQLQPARDALEQLHDHARRTDLDEAGRIALELGGVCATLGDKAAAERYHQEGWRQSLYSAGIS